MCPDAAVPSLSPAPWRTARQVLLGTAILLVAACASGPHKPQTTYKDYRSGLADLPARAPNGNAGTANDVPFRAIALVGTAYRWWGNTPDGGFDCSGLVDYIYRNAAGLMLPHSAREMSQLSGQ